MENDLISKKELLEAAGISYGQLYRWKRKGLIPEDWFIRRSTFTGQETFFPRDKVLERVNRIMNMKEDVSLDDLADVFSPQTGDLCLDAGQVIARGIADSAVTALYGELYGIGDYPFEEMVYLSIFDELFSGGGISRDEAVAAIKTVKKKAGEFKDGFCELYAVRKLGLFTCFLASSPCSIRFEEGVRVVARISIPAVKEKLKMKLL
jgi:hypothetical protein